MSNWTKLCFYRKAALRVPSAISFETLYHVCHAATVARSSTSGWSSVSWWAADTSRPTQGENLSESRVQDLNHFVLNCFSDICQWLILESPFGHKLWFRSRKFTGNCDSRVVIYERKMLIRLDIGVTVLECDIFCPLDNFSAIQTSVKL